VRLLDRYVIRNFLQVYLYCIAGFISIWLIFDISDNISTFIDERVGFTFARAPFFAGANVARE
jgi:lipopolysaccharide export LptBFGC system permease protein LptF